MAIISNRIEQESLQKGTDARISLKDKIETIASTILSYENKKNLFINTLQEIQGKFEFSEEFMNRYDIKDECITRDIILRDLGGMKIASVDGSILRESMLGMELIASKSRGAVFRFYKEKSPVVRYYPIDRNQNLNIQGIFRNTSKKEVEFLTNAERLLSELKLIYQIIKDEKYLDMMILDGSLYLPEIFNSNDNYSKSPYNKKITQLLINILNICRERDTIVVGVLKDSIRSRLSTILRYLIPYEIKRDGRFKKFLEFNYPQILNLFKDYDLFYRLLGAGQRTFAMQIYPGQEENKPKTLFERYLDVKDIGLYSYLIKCVPMDVPLCIEFFSQNKKYKVMEIIKKSSSLLYPLSTIVFNYSEPSPQMEAHKRVKISEYEFKLLVDVIRNKTGFCSSLLPKRRDRKPL